MTLPAGRPTVAIVGGGFSGAAVAYHLALLDLPARIVVFEPQHLLGAGLAYATRDPQHRINVPAAKMSLVPGDGDHFVRWIGATEAVADDPDVRGPDGELYPRRLVFGQYVDSHLAPFVDKGRIEHARERVARIKRGGGRWLIVTDAGRQTTADVVVLATTHPLPEAPSVLSSALAGDQRFIVDPYRPIADLNVDPAARILIVGTGLTMADVVASLDAGGHVGPITALSRRGLRSRGHSAQAAEPFGEFAQRPSATAVQLLRRVRATIAEAERSGFSWHPVIDAIRAQAQIFWPALPLSERRRIVRHLRPYWDAHRFRIAPQPEGVLAKRIAQGCLGVLAGKLTNATPRADGIEVAARARGSSSVVSNVFDLIFITTGPAHDRVLVGEPHLASLAAAGWLTPDPAQLGIACDRAARAIGWDGAAVPGLLVAGPLARGTFGELMGLPQVSDFAKLVAEQVGDALSRKGQRAEVAATA